MQQQSKQRDSYNIISGTAAEVSKEQKRIEPIEIVVWCDATN